MVLSNVNLVSSQLEVIDGMPDLGVTSYRTDADGNVVFGPNTPKDRMKTSVTGKKTPTRKGEGTTKLLQMLTLEEVLSSPPLFVPLQTLSPLSWSS